MSPIAKIEIAIPITNSKMITDRDRDRSFPIADRLGYLFTYISCVNFMKTWDNSSLEQRQNKKSEVIPILKLPLFSPDRVGGEKARQLFLTEWSRSYIVLALIERLKTFLPDFFEIREKIWGLLGIFL